MKMIKYAIAEIFNRAIDTKLVQSNIDQLASVVLARASYERRRLEAGSEGFLCGYSQSRASNLTSTLDEDILPTMIGVLEGGIEMAHQGSFRFLLLFWEGYHTSNSVTLH